MLNKQLLPLLLVCIAVAVTTTTTAASTAAEDATVTCNTVYNDLEPCLGYVLGGGPSVPSECCNGIKSLLRAARTTADRQSACKCVKSVASSATGQQISRAAKIPGICKANVPFKINANVDCSKIK
ncbi:non-specific lipid-transfer protein 1-like [Lycium barbarum]|uniref:non-specific lipid-transfer protein 1-like n=1 Tax=Lycium barbarum TaxID=112863 RepID=UPI00293E23B8|nr:non-specific lipid-transfer protein 1-like [Lycium barbarum]